MSSILYYSNHCEHSKKLLQMLSKTQLGKDIHFICIDRRVNEGGKMYIILENNQKIIMPENVAKVPALLLLSTYQVLYGDNIYNHFKTPQVAAVKQATNNNMEPMEPSAFSLGGGGGGLFGIISDQYSFLDMEPESLNTKGNGGMRQMHNYVQLNHIDAINTPAKDEQGSNKLGENMTIEKLQQQREQELSSLNMSKRI
jgi:hypothetical protein